MFLMGIIEVEQLRKLPCRKLIIATDNDSAGLKAGERIKEKIKNKILTRFVFPENRKDINELSKEEFENLEEIFFIKFCKKVLTNIIRCCIIQVQ